ncbi:hypothetical protein M3Y98_00717900 [Aphelenchoides besseyi]|nr:hypothetical protein M3Y98_00717900 [Aphelenchoides besseyi]KAI6210266.1 hypothetical protein M3Y96_00309900 [Aphelenchoides besseyi]
MVLNVNEWIARAGKRLDDLEMRYRSAEEAEKAEAERTQQEDVIPPYVNDKNEFEAKNLGRFYYFFRLILIEDLAALVLVLSLLISVLGGVQVAANLTHELNVQQTASGVLIVFSILLHLHTFIGIQRRQRKRQRLFLIYTFLESMIALGFDFHVVFTFLVHHHCNSREMTVATFLSFITVSQIVSAHFVWENLSYLREYVYTDDYITARAEFLAKKGKLTEDEYRDLLVRQIPPSIRNRAHSQAPQRRQKSIQSFDEMNVSTRRASSVFEAPNQQIEEAKKPVQPVSFNVKIVDEEAICEMRERIFGDNFAYHTEINRRI